jgi:hypothetical protein
MSRIFISYRRSDSAMAAGRLYDHLSNHFSDHLLFMDIDTIEPGEDFVEVLQNAVGSCQALVAVIGPEWLSSTDQAGQRRLDDPNDFVRLEIAAALERNIRVIPVLVDGASMPTLQDLPDVLAKLARRNALFISNERFRYDIGKLIATLDRVFQSDSAVEVQPNQPVSDKRTVPRWRGAIRAITASIKSGWWQPALVVIGWAVGIAVMVYMLNLDSNNLSALTLAGAIGGITTALVLWTRIPTFRLLHAIVVITGWSVALTVVGLLTFQRDIRNALIELTLGVAVAGLVTGLSIYWKAWVKHWKRILIISMGWAVGSFIANVVISPITQPLSAINELVAWSGIWGAIVGAIGGGIMFWQLRSTHPLNKP